VDTIMHTIMWIILTIFAALVLTAYVDHASRTQKPGECLTSSPDSETTP
jgi:hypothetical protein